MNPEPRLSATEQLRRSNPTVDSPTYRRLSGLDPDPRHVADPFADRDDIYVEPYVADPFPVGWDVLAAIVIAAACVAYVLWRWA